jgi:hypothetical protein
MLHGKGANENLPKEHERTMRVSGSKSSSGLRGACSAGYGFFAATKRGYWERPTASGDQRCEKKGSHHNPTREF